MNTRDLINRLELSGVPEETLMDSKTAPEVRIRLPSAQGDYVLDISLKDVQYDNKTKKIQLITGAVPPSYPQGGPVPEHCSSYVEAKKNVDY